MKTRLLAVSTALVTFVSLTAFADSSFISNDIKYKDSGMKPATGRAGDASIEALALLGRDGTTDLAIAAAGGEIGKVQLKLPGDITENFTGLSGSSFTHRLQGLGRHDPLGVSVNVDGAERTAVVSATETVKLRPDLVLRNVTAAPHALAGAPYIITAVVSEVNGDVGARASCVLLRDGAEIDRAGNIWVDAGGTVSCEFSHVFGPGTGTAQLSVALVDANPAEFDASNNGAQPFTVRVYDRLSEFEDWNYGAWEETAHRRTYSRTANSESENVSDTWLAATHYRATFREQFVGVETLRASVRTVTDGQVIHESHDIHFDFERRFDWDWDISYECAKGQIDDRYSMIVSCRITTPWDGSYTTFAYNLSAGDSTFISRGWFRTFFGTNPEGDVHYINWEQHDVFGNPFHLGENVSIDVQLSDGSSLWEAHPSFALTSSSGNSEQPLTCMGDGPWQWCFASSETFTRKSAFVAAPGM